MPHFRTRRRVEFADTDMAGICHFARFFVFLETAEHEFLRSLGTNVMLETAEGEIGWPRVSAACDYLASARFGDVLDIDVSVARKGRTSLTYTFDVSRDGTPIARGRVTAVCCLLEPEGAKPIPIPAGLAERIEEAPESPGLPPRR